MPLLWQWHITCEVTCDILSTGTEGCLVGWPRKSSWYIWLSVILSPTCMCTLYCTSMDLCLILEQCLYTYLFDGLSLIMPVYHHLLSTFIELLRLEVSNWPDVTFFFIFVDNVLAGSNQAGRGVSTSVTLSAQNARQQFKGTSFVTLVDLPCPLKVVPSLSRKFCGFISILFFVCLIHSLLPFQKKSRYHFPTKWPCPTRCPTCQAKIQWHLICYIRHFD